MYKNFQVFSLTAIRGCP